MKVPFFNRSLKPVTVGDMTIMPGCCRDVEEHLLDTYKPVTKTTDTESDDFDLDTVLDLNLGELEEALSGYTVDQLKQIKDAEEAQENPRKGAIQMLNVELLSRADAGE